MELLNLICNFSAVVFFGALLLVALLSFGTSVFACFSKKTKGALWAKVLVAFAFACVCPWIFKVMMFFVLKL